MSGSTRGVMAAGRSTYARKLLAQRHVQNPAASELGVERHKTRQPVFDAADDGREGTAWVSPHGFECPLGVEGGDHGDEGALVGRVEGVDAEQLTERPHGGLDRD